VSDLVEYHPDPNLDFGLAGLALAPNDRLLQPDPATVSAEYPLSGVPQALLRRMEYSPCFEEEVSAHKK
jgi:hypothetical protein